jgi:hypothetical protein
MAGWINRNQQNVIEYLQEEVRVLKEQLGKKHKFNDDQPPRVEEQDHPSGIHSIPQRGGPQTSKAAGRTAELLLSRSCLRALMFEFSDSTGNKKPTS